ncbi:MAG: lipopolysaccharide assembly protein LapB, partial [Burkholderiales bacterium PBB5]
MDLDTPGLLLALLVALPVAFGLGWLGSRLDLRQWKRADREAPKAYFKGLNLLLNEQPDKAIDAFIEAVQHDPDTSELHFTLGNLFRRRGEFERAIRVHQHLLQRADLSAGDRQRAQYALAQDFMRAGLFDRAEEAYQALAGTPFDTESRLALLGLYERSRDWGPAAQIAQKLENAGQGSFKGRLAHYLCEQALASTPEHANTLLMQAIATAPEAARARLQLAELQHQQGNTALALATLVQAVDAAPNAVALLAPRIAALAVTVDPDPQFLALLKSVYQSTPSLDVLDAIVSLEAFSAESTTTARDWYAHHLEKEPSLVAAAKWIAGEKLEHEQFHPQVQ